MIDCELRKPRPQSDSMVTHAYSAVKWCTTHGTQVNALSKNIENLLKVIGIIS